MIGLLSLSLAPWRARQLLAKRSVKFSPENLRVKNDKEVIFYPAFQGSAFAPFLRNGCAALPIGARLNFLDCSFFLRSQAHHPF